MRAMGRSPSGNGPRSSASALACAAGEPWADARSSRSGPRRPAPRRCSSFLATNRGRLRGERLRLPGLLRARSNHTGLAAYAMDPAQARRHPRAVRLPLRGRRRADARAAARGGGPELARRGDRDLLQRALPQPARRPRRRWRRCATSSAASSTTSQVGVYLRRQDQVALSLYSTRLKSGGTDRDDPAADRRRRSLLQLRPLAGALGGRASAARTCTSACSTAQTLVGGTSSTTSSRPGSSAGPRAYAPVAEPERVDPRRWPRSSCAW